MTRGKCDKNFPVEDLMMHLTALGLHEKNVFVCLFCCRDTAPGSISMTCTYCQRHGQTQHRDKNPLKDTRGGCN